MPTVYVVTSQAKYSDYQYPVAVFSKVIDADEYINKRCLDGNSYYLIDVLMDEDVERPFIRLLISKSGDVSKGPFATGMAFLGLLRDQFYCGDLLVTAWTSDWQKAVDIAKATRLLVLANGYTDWSRNVAI